MITLMAPWMEALPLQQQSVLFLACRGPDGVRKHHPCKDVVRAYRGSVLKAAKFGRFLEFGEKADTFMSLDRFADLPNWLTDCAAFFNTIDELPHHYIMHLIHGAQILGYKHPDKRFSERWHRFYIDAVCDAHLEPESLEAMDNRLSDWHRQYW